LAAVKVDTAASATTLARTKRFISKPP